MKLASTSNPEGLQFVEEFVYAYNVTGGAVAQNDMVEFDLELTTNNNANVGGLTSGWSTYRTPNTLGVSAGFFGIVRDANLAPGSLALTKLCVRSQYVPIRCATTTIVQGWSGHATIGSRNMTLAAAPTGTIKVMAIYVDPATTIVAGDAINCAFEGINSFR